MSTRQLSTNKQTIVGINKTVAQKRIRQAYLAVPYDAGAREIIIQFTDPTLIYRGVVARARIRPGLVIPIAPVGSSVTISIEHGQLTVIGF
jgi:hypothetical protein